MKKYISLLIASFLVLSFSITDLEAKGSKGGGGGFSGGGYKKSSSSIPKSDNKQKYSGSYEKSSGGYSSEEKKAPKVENISVKSDKPEPVKPKLDSFEKAKLAHQDSVDSKKVLDEYRAKQSMFKSKSSSPDIPLEPKAKNDTKNYFASSGNDSKSSYNTYTSRKNDFYYRYSPPSYYNPSAFAPNYGRWDGFFLGYMVSDAMSDLGRFLHHNSSDPGVSEWKKSLEREAQNNAELKAKLDKANAQIAELEKSNTSKQAGYIPVNVDKDIAFSDKYVEANKDKLYSKEEKEEDSSMFSILTTLGGILGISALIWFVFFRRTL